MSSIQFATIDCVPVDEMHFVVRSIRLPANKLKTREREREDGRETEILLSHSVSTNV